MSKMIKNCVKLQLRTIVGISSLSLLNPCYGYPTLVNPTNKGLDRLVVSESDLREHGETKVIGQIGTVTDIIAYTESGQRIIYSCSGYQLNTPPTLKPTKPLIGEKWDKFLGRAVNDLSQCTWKVRPNTGIGDQKIKRFDIRYSSGYKGHEGHGNTYLVLHDLPYIPEIEPAKCTGNTSKNIDFGVIRRGDFADHNATSYGAITLQCNANVSVTLSVNNGLDLHNADGSEIHFEYPRTVDMKNGFEEVIDIRALLGKPPGTPGDYKWSVPVMIQYP
ncbi:hypothetical protein GOP90_08785 [Vibrio cholerae]|uniref:hypothetical protein n=1 Tax=Vibrio cholerae TaxID=666 RepID=UPI002DA75B9E|nr:hypothetical protein [Vibrio cholerae]MEB5620689.1 hypothetical protein [Vibrio cholerae]